MTAVTNPRGRCFISYRRLPHRVDEAVRLQMALNDRGVPTWRDMVDLAPRPTERELDAILADPDTAGAVMLVCSEVQDSSMIRNVEAPNIFARVRPDDPFFVRPVLIDVDYPQADDMLGRPAGFQNLQDWNLTRLGEDLLDDEAAKLIATKVLQDRLTAISTLEPKELQIGIFTRRLDQQLSYDIRHDFSGYFAGRLPTTCAYPTIERALVDTAKAILRSNAPRSLIVQGACSYAAAILFGAVFSPLAPFQVRWLQSLPGHSPELWGLDTGSTSARLSVSESRGDPASNQIVLAMGVNASIESASADYLRETGLKPRVCLYAEPEGGPLRQGQSLSSTEGLSLALQAVDALRDAKDKLRMKTAEVHLFLACPVAMAMLIGQKLNTFAMCHLYEHAPDRSPAYVKVHAFNPSAYSYS